MLTSKKLILDKIYYVKYLFHLSLSLSVFYIGEYSLVFILQLTFLVTFIKKKYGIYILYIPIVILALTKLFASLYFLYFLNLLFFLYYLYLNNLIFKYKELIVFIFYVLGLVVLFLKFEDFIYDFYIDYGYIDAINYISNETIFALNLLHLFILFLLRYNKEKLFLG
jgi:hypothetical protein